MKLRYIGMTEELSQIFSDKRINALIFNSRFIRNFLSLAIRKYKYETKKDYRMICICINSKHNIPYINVNYAFCVPISISKEEIWDYLNMTNLVDRYEFYLSILERGYYKAAEYFDDVPVDILLALHQQFREGGYKNEWLFKKKPIKEYGIYVYLKCYFTTFEFRLELEVYDLKQTHLIAKEVIFRSLPDETFFDYLFKSIKIEDNFLYIIGFIETPMIKIDLELLAKGQIKISYLRKSLAEEQQNIQQTLQKVRW